MGVVALAVAGCLTTHDVLVDRSWTLMEIGGAPPVAEAGVSFGTDGRFSMRTGCNTGGGSYHLDGNRILLDGMNLTAIGCEEPVRRQEEAILVAIGGAPVFSFDTGTGRLRLTGGAGEPLVFEAP
jgi:heat shock protein HslJ